MTDTTAPTFTLYLSQTVENVNDSTRFNRIMNRVDEWAEDNAGWDCRDEAVAEVEYLLAHDDHRNMTDDEIVDEAISAWLSAE